MRVALIWLLLAISGIKALYEDQVGKFDWRRRSIGSVTSVVASDDTRSVEVTTADNVLASLDAKTGDIQWRKVFEARGTVRKAVRANGVIIALTTGCRYLRAFEAKTGVLLWERIVGKEAQLSENCDIILLPSDDQTRAVVLTPAGDVASYEPRTGSEVGKTTSLGGDDLSTLLSDESGVVAFGGKPGASFSLVRLALQDDEERPTKHEAQRFSAPWYLPDRCAVVGRRYVCYNPTDRLAYFVDLWKPGKAFASVKTADAPTTFSHLSGSLHSDVFILHDGAAARVYAIAGTGAGVEARLVGVVEGATISQVELNKRVTVVTVAGGKVAVQTYEITSGNELNKLDRIEIPAMMFQATIVKALSVSLKEGSIRYLLLGEDLSVHYVMQSNRLVWSREEALSDITDAQFMDLPLSAEQANIEHEFDVEGSGPAALLRMVRKRIRSQLLQLQQLVLRLLSDALATIAMLRDELQSISSWSDVTRLMDEHRRMQADLATRDAFERDYFSLHKMIVVTTGCGKLFGIDNRQGRIRWSTFLGPNTQPLPQTALHVLRSTAHDPHPARALLIVRVKSDLQLIEFEPMTGRVIERTPVADKKLLQYVPLPVHDATGVHGVVLLHGERKATVYPPTAIEQLRQLGRVYAFVVDTDSTEMKGFSIAPAAEGTEFQVFQLIVKSTYLTRISDAETATISTVKMRKLSEQVHSLGRVLGDRSVLYKYVNPNLVAVATENDGSSETVPDEGTGVGESRKSVAMHLMDAVTGAVIFSATHPRCTGPVRLVHSENWVVYTYWNMKARRTELAVLELYEGGSQADPLAFSSYRPSGPPIVMRQAYVFAQGASAMAVTDTERGITHRHLLIALPMGGILQLPKAFADPRRSIVPTPEHREEGLIPYMPELPIATEHIVNYNQTVLRVRNIATAASGLESTSLVLAYGLDMFSTRVTPSNTFDILKEDFDHYFIAFVLAALLLGSVVSKRLARRKDLKEAWK